MVSYPGLGSDPPIGSNRELGHDKYEENPVEILAREVIELWKKQIPLVKVLWRNHKTEEATWESEEVMRQQYKVISRTKFF